MGVQLLGFGIGVVLLAWCASVAFSEKNRAQQARIADAAWTDVALLAALSIATLAVNSGAFWSMIQPVRRLGFGRVLAVNTVATTLAYLPFKLSILFRAGAHNRRDGVPLLTVGAWIANVGLVMVAVIAPVLGASAWRERIDALWWTAAAGGMFTICLAMLLTARLLTHERVWGVLERWVHGPGGHAAGWRRVVRRAQLLPRAHEGVLMLSHPSAVFGGAALRALDIGVQSARFIIAARIVGMDLPLSQAVSAAAGYFVIGVLSPTGMLGFREGVFTLLRSESFAVVVLTVSALEMVVNLAAAIPAALALRAAQMRSSGASETPGPRADPDKRRA
jgi:hypothetical protein